MALGLSPGADLTDEEVRAAWRRIAAATHPDRDDGGDPARFAAAAAAYTALRSPFGRGEARAELAAQPELAAQAPRPKPSMPRPRASAGMRPGSPARAAARVSARIRDGRPGRLTLRVLASAAASTVVVLAAWPRPAAPALIAGVLTWLVLTGRHDLAAPVRSPDQPRHLGVGQMTDGFDPARYTAAPLQTEGVIRFAGSPDAVFARITNHLAMTDWVPLLKTVQVSHPKPLAPGESMLGTTRELALRGGVTIREEIVYWDPPRCYAYTTEGKRWPMRNYVGFMGVQGPAGGGGAFIFREYFCVDGALRRALVSKGVVTLGRRALRNLSKLISGTSAEFRHVQVHRQGDRKKGS